MIHQGVHPIGVLELTDELVSNAGLLQSSSNRNNEMMIYCIHSFIVHDLLMGLKCIIMLSKIGHHALSRPSCIAFLYIYVMYLCIDIYVNLFILIY